VGLRAPAVGSWELRAPVAKSGCVSRDNANRGGSELLEEKCQPNPLQCSLQMLAEQQAISN